MSTIEAGSTVIDFERFFEALARTRLQSRAAEFRQRLDARYFQRIHGDHPLWQAAFLDLPDIDADAGTTVTLDADTVSVRPARPLSAEVRAKLKQALMGLHPWRKGPFDLHGVFIDTEWRSDWKWRRLENLIQPLAGRYVLDVGCGNGYHCWRMAGAGAALVVGIDPSQKFLFQFEAVRNYLGDHPVHFLPLRAEDLPPNLEAFDTVFSMGVLYHRNSPFAHLNELKQALKPGGELVLETLVVDGDATRVLVPQDRYAQMRNVWFLPSPAALVLWLQKMGFIAVRIANVNTTSTEEQRATEWMRFHSLANFLDPGDAGKTIEGYQAPTRAIIIARKPE